MHHKDYSSVHSWLVVVAAVCQTIWYGDGLYNVASLDTLGEIYLSVGIHKMTRSHFIFQQTSHWTELSTQQVPTCSRLLVLHYEAATSQSPSYQQRTNAQLPTSIHPLFSDRELADRSR